MIKIFFEIVGILNIYILYEYLIFCLCNISKKKMCVSFLFLKLMIINYVYFLVKFNLKDNLLNKF